MKNEVFIIKFCAFVPAIFLNKKAADVTRKLLFTTSISPLVTITNKKRERRTTFDYIEAAWYVSLYTHTHTRCIALRIAPISFDLFEPLDKYIYVRIHIPYPFFLLSSWAALFLCRSKTQSVTWEIEKTAKASSALLSFPLTTTTHGNERQCRRIDRTNFRLLMYK